MGYYVRAFCASETVPTPRTLLEYTKKKGFSLGLEAVGIDMDNDNWEQLVWVYKDGKLPILMECNRNTSEDCLFREEIDEFLDFIGKPGISLKKRRVIGHLKESKYIIACQLPTSDIDDDGHDATGTLLTYFVVNHSAIIQADGEGFYEGNKVVVAIE
jgi:hypothetical protein